MLARLSFSRAHTLDTQPLGILSLMTAPYTTQDGGGLIKYANEAIIELLKFPFKLLVKLPTFINVNIHPPKEFFKKKTTV